VVSARFIRRLLCNFSAAALLLTAPLFVFLPAPAAYASIPGGLGYPHADMPCAHHPYGAHGECDNFDWGPVRDSELQWNVNNTYSERGYGYRNCTDYAAWRLQRLGAPDAKTRGLGHAREWADKAGKNGLHWSFKPKAGSVAVAKGGYGHVAVVEAVHADGTITVSEYNRDGKGNGSVWTGRAHERGFTKFVDFGVGSAAAETNDKAAKPSADEPQAVKQVSAPAPAVSPAAKPPSRPAQAAPQPTAQAAETRAAPIPPGNPYISKMIRQPIGTISRVDDTGTQHWIPTMEIVGCLGGNVIQLDDATFMSIPASPNAATCQSFALGRMVRFTDGTIYYIDINGFAHHVPTWDIASCLGGAATVMQFDDAAFATIQKSPVPASCASVHYGKQFRNPAGLIGFVSSNGTMHWIPDDDTLKCLGSRASVVQVSDAVFNQFPSGGAATCATR
jgi:surface antigen